LRSAEDAHGAARLAAAEVAAVCRCAVADRGQAVIALSGGETPWQMLRELREYDLPWNRIHVGQVDERIAPAGDARRNRGKLEAILVRGGPLPAARLLAMPVEAKDLAAAAGAYQHLLEHYAGVPARLDLVQLGLGADGHTASLVPGDPVLAVRDRDVALTGEYQGLRRMTLTYPVLSRARVRLWLVTGAGKLDALRDLLAATGDAPAIAVAREDTIVIADSHALCRPCGRGAE
jgi:6-phosphogluconolactonase